MVGVAIGGDHGDRARPVRRGCREEVVGLVSRRLPDRESERLGQHRQDLQLLENPVLELTAGLVGRELLVAVGGRLERVPPDQHRVGLLGIPEAHQEACEADQSVSRAAVAADRLRNCVIGAMRQRVAVDREQRPAHAVASSSAIAAITRSVAIRAASAGRQSPGRRLDRRAVTDAPRAKRPQAVGSADAGGHERHARVERDARGAGMCLRLPRLAQALLAACPFREHRDHVAVASERDRRLDRLQVGLAAVHLEAAARLDDHPEREPEELRLGHEAQEPVRPDRQAERPRIEIREVAGREHVAP